MEHNQKQSPKETTSSVKRERKNGEQSQILFRSHLRKLTSLQSQAVRMALQIRKRDWHRGACLTRLDWFSGPQMAAQSTIKQEIQTLQTRHPKTYMIH